jgi:hypothetical protein
MAERCSHTSSFREEARNYRSVVSPALLRFLSAVEPVQEFAQDKVQLLRSALRIGFQHVVLAVSRRR